MLYLWNQTRTATKKFLDPLSLLWAILNKNGKALPFTELETVFTPLTKMRVSVYSK
jgi:hypothetical protein